MHPKGANEWNGKQSRPRSDCSLGADSDLGLDCLFRLDCLKIFGHYTILTAYAALCSQSIWLSCLEISNNGLAWLFGVISWNMCYNEMFVVLVHGFAFVWLRPNKNICVFQVSRPYLGFCSDPKHFMVKIEQYKKMAQI